MNPERLEEKYKNLFENTPYSIILGNLHGKILDCNSNALRMFGYEREEFIGKDFKTFSIFSPEDLKMVLKDIKSLMKGKISKTKEFKVKRKDGTRIWISSALSIVNYKNDVIFQLFIQDITSRKEAELQLKESEGRYRHLFLSAPYMIILTNQEGNILDFNPATFKYITESKKKLIGKKFKELNLFSGTELKEIEALFNEVIKKGYCKPCEFKLKREIDGNLIWINFQATLINFQDQTIIQAIIQDVSEKKEAEQIIEESETKFRNLFEDASLAIIILDVQGNIIEYNYLLEKLLGVEKGELVYKNIKDVLSKSEFRQFFNLNLKKFYQKGIPISLEIPIYAENMNLKWFNLFYSLINVQENKYIQVIIQDITEKKEAEQKLKESEEKYRLISEDSDDLIVIFNENLAIEYANEKSHSRIIGYAPERFKSRAFLLSLIHEEDRKKAAETFKKGYKKGLYKTQIRIRRESGKYLWFELHGKMFVDKHGKIKMMCVSRDITGIKKVEIKLKELNDLKTKLMRRTSHELKTPLVSIIGASNLLLDVYRDDLNENTRSFIELIKSGGERLNNLVEDLLDISKLESRTFPLKKKKENLIEIIINCINEMKMFAKSREISIIFDDKEESGESWIACIDKNRFKQVIINLLSNAIKNTPQKGKIFVNLEKSSENHIDIKIKDTGIGFSKDEMSQIFKKFGKIERYDKGLDINSEGSGLGLYISKEIVELHEGKIWVESKGFNKGATLIVRLSSLH